MIEIRSIRLDEIPIIQYIAQNTWPKTFGEVLSSEQINYMLELMYSKESLTKQIQEKNHKFLLALKEKNPLGFASYELNYNSKPQTMIHKLYLLPSFQRMGVGTKMIDFVSEIARGNDNYEIRLKVYFDNPYAIGFYEKIGFYKDGTETTDIGNNYHIVDYVMIKKI